MLATKAIKDSPVNDSELLTKEKAGIVPRSRKTLVIDASEEVDRLYSHFQQNIEWFKRKPWIPHDNVEIKAQLYFRKLYFCHQAMQLKESIKAKSETQTVLHQQFLKQYEEMYLLLKNISDQYQVMQTTIAQTITNTNLDASPLPPFNARVELFTRDLDIHSPFSPIRERQVSYSPLFFPIKPPPLTLDRSALEADVLVDCPCIQRHSELNKNIFSTPNVISSAARDPLKMAPNQDPAPCEIPRYARDDVRSYIFS